MNDTLKSEETLNEEVTKDKTIEEGIEIQLKKDDRIVKMIDHETLSLNGDAYKIMENYREGLDLELLEARYSDFLDKYDYIVGDISYEKLRLRGFYYSKNKKVPIDMRISSLKDYLTEYCNFGCAYFVLERMEPKKKQKPQSKRKGKSNPNKKTNQNTKQTTKQSNQKKPDHSKKLESKATPKRKEQTEREQAKKGFTKKGRQPSKPAVTNEPSDENNKVKTVKNQKGETKFKIRQKNKTES